MTHTQTNAQHQDTLVVRTVKLSIVAELTTFMGGPQQTERVKIELASSYVCLFRCDGSYGDGWKASLRMDMPCLAGCCGHAKAGKAVALEGTCAPEGGSLPFSLRLGAAHSRPANPAAGHAPAAPLRNVARALSRMASPAMHLGASCYLAPCRTAALGMAGKFGCARCANVRSWRWPSLRLYSKHAADKFNFS